MQGSSNFSVLTDMGQQQAQAAAELVSSPAGDVGQTGKTKHTCMQPGNLHHAGTALVTATAAAVVPRPLLAPAHPTWHSHNNKQPQVPSMSSVSSVSRPPACQLSGWDFEVLFVSPLKRAVETSRIVWGGRRAPVLTLPSLREIDLYTFQASGDGLWRVAAVGVGRTGRRFDGRSASACCKASHVPLPLPPLRLCCRSVCSASAASAAARGRPNSRLACLPAFPQGLDKLENRSLYPEQYVAWQSNPADFTIDGHAPVSLPHWAGLLAPGLGDWGAW